MTEALVQVEFEEMSVISEGGVDVFVYHWGDREETPPYYIEVEERRFSFSGQTLLVRGHGALLPKLAREQQAEGRIPLLVQRGDRYLIYLHDPAEDTDQDED